jgi:hypothetical protein
MVLFSSHGFAQELIPLHSDFSTVINQAIIENNGTQQTFIRPFIKNNLSKDLNIDSILTFSIKNPLKRPGWIIRKWRYESLLEVDSSDFSVHADPFFELSYGQNLKKTNMVNSNTRGFRAWGNIGKNLYYETSFLESQSVFLPYLADFINSANVVPGQGQSRRFGKNGFDYSIASGLLSLGIGKRWNIIFGHGKNFVGDGYRSLFLSDNAFNYPYLRLSITYNKWYFSRIMAVTMSDKLPRLAFGVREKRLAGFNIITYVPSAVFQISFFEGNIFKYPNERNDTKFNYLFFNPVVASNSLIKTNTYQSLTGLGIKISLFRHLVLYNQLAIYNPANFSAWGNKSGFQTGLKYFNAFFIRNLNLQLEYNRSGKNSYVLDDSLQYYSHFNQSLAHPLGNNFTESVYIANYRIRCWQINATLSNATYGLAGLSQLTKKSSYVNTIQYITPFISQGPQTTSSNLAISISYLLNASTNRKIEIGYIKRDASITGVGFFNDYFFIAFRTMLDNHYYDF